MDVRSLSEDSGIGEEVRRLINLSLHKDFVSRQFFHKLTYGDPNFNPKYALVSVRSGVIVAAAVGVRRVREPAAAVEEQRDIAWLKVLAAAKGEERALAELIGILEEEYSKEGVRQVKVSDYASWYLAPGVDVEYEWLLRLLQASGYAKVGEAVNYEVDMARFVYPERVRAMAKRLEEGGFTFRAASASEREALGRWVEEGFSPFWRVEMEMGLAAEDGSVLVAETREGYVGFSVHGALRPDFFGPIGVSPDARGSGVGTVLLFDTLRQMRVEGVRVVTVPWTTHLTFYTQIPGVCGVRTFYIMAKSLRR